MNFIEYLTIYLAIGAPIGVHFFLRERNSSTGYFLWLKSLLVGLFWIFYAARLIYSRQTTAKKTRNFSSPNFSSRNNEIEKATRTLQNNFAEFSLKHNLSFFAFRELLERYVGLSLAAQNASAEEVSPQELEIFRVGADEKRGLQIAGRCVHRRNLLRLAAHQIRARRDFLDSCREIAKIISDDFDSKSNNQSEFLKTALSLAKLLYDIEATDCLRQTREMCEQTRQTEPTANVLEGGRQEKDLWKTLQPEQTLSIIQTASPLRLTSPRD